MRKAYEAKLRASSGSIRDASGISPDITDETIRHGQETLMTNEDNLRLNSWSIIFILLSPYPTMTIAKSTIICVATVAPILLFTYYGAKLLQMRIRNRKLMHIFAESN